MLKNSIADAKRMEKLEKLKAKAAKGGVSGKSAAIELECMLREDETERNRQEITAAAAQRRAKKEVKNVDNDWQDFCIVADVVEEMIKCIVGNSIVANVVENMIRHTIYLAENESKMEEAYQQNLIRECACKRKEWNRMESHEKKIEEKCNTPKSSSVHINNATNRIVHNNVRVDVTPHTVLRRIISLAPRHSVYTIKITIPKGTHAGNNVHVNLPNGRSIDVTVPKGKKAGNTMTINYDDDAPVQESKTQSSGIDLKFDPNDDDCTTLLHTDSGVEISSGEEVKETPAAVLKTIQVGTLMEAISFDDDDQVYDWFNCIVTNKYLKHKGVQICFVNETDQPKGKKVWTTRIQSRDDLDLQLAQDELSVAEAQFAREIFVRSKNNTMISKQHKKSIKNWEVCMVVKKKETFFHHHYRKSTKNTPPIAADLHGGEKKRDILKKRNSNSVVGLSMVTGKEEELTLNADEKTMVNAIQLTQEIKLRIEQMEKATKALKLKQDGFPNRLLKLEKLQQATLAKQEEAKTDPALLPSAVRLENELLKATVSSKFLFL